MNVETTTYANGEVAIFLRGKQYKDGRWVNMPAQFLGLVSDFPQYEDPVAHFRQFYKEETKKQKAQEKLDALKSDSSSVSIMLNLNEQLGLGESAVRNIGYVAFKRIYKELRLDEFWRRQTRGLKIEYDMEKIFYLLVISRLMDPGSKRYTFANKDQYFEPLEGIELEQIYKAMDLIAANDQPMQQWIYHQSKSFIQRDTEVCYYDGTNYYFDISHPDIDEVDDEGNIADKKLRKRGPEKNHRPDPIVSMGLLLDKNALPVTYTLYPGNESEKVHMIPAIERARRGQMIGRIINVADRGLNTSENIWHLSGANDSDKPGRMDGYVFGKSVRAADKQFKEWVLDPKGYETVYLDPDRLYSDDEDVDSSNGKVKFTYKIRNEVVRLNIHVEMPDGSVKIKQPKTSQRQMVYYSEKYARKQRLERELMIERAKDLIANPKKYDRVTSAGSASYIRNINFNKDTGEVTGRNLSLDYDKIAEEEKYDGYYAIVTSEMEMAPAKIRDVYRGLIRIEHTFRITKSEMETRPAYVWTTEHIKAHFSTCYAALCMLKFLMYRMDNEYTASRILDSLRKCNVTEEDSTYWQFTYYDEVLARIEKLFGIDLRTRHRTRQQLRRLLRY